MSQRTRTQRRTWKERAISLLLAAALMAGLTPGLTLPASAEHWADAYLDQLVDWGVIRADQTADPDADLTRAEFMAITNRAYGYTETGPTPFEDVLPTDWFYDDVSIAYTAGYMKGTSETTASPNSSLTREQAVCILGRNMMMKETPGESLAFSDSRDISDWARGTVKTAVDNYLISGYPDNSFHPLDAISRGQMAALITQCIGTPVQASGEYEMGNVFGNLTITAPNVTLRNTTISGDLYVSGGVGLGGIKLENVDVLGRIIVSGTGESEGGDASVIMRNVTAAEMLVDNMRNKTVTIRADGITNIAKTVVRTNAYLEDNNTDEEGLLHIEVNGDPGLRLTLAGRIKEVVNKTPSSYIQVAKGTVAKITADEAAIGSIIQIDRNTKVAELNLDVATNVYGDGDIGQLNINAPGSTVTMLPDHIYIRPGLNASIAGVIMDYQAAEEGSLDPRLLSGYPAAKDITPTGFRADFATNKKGTVYWAVSYVSDGSIGEEALISPPSYGNKAIANGTVAAPVGGDEVSTQVDKLVVGGSYYLSAMVVDDQQNRSPVKVISFSTPDNTVPAFAQGYPYMSRIKSDRSLVAVMATKSCKLYYALLPQGAQAPTPNDLKAAAVTGNLGYGVRDLTKNTESVFQVNIPRLEELKSYVLYLWLTDADGANSSAVRSLPFTIPDETPPKIDPIPYLDTQRTTGTSLSVRTGMNEKGTIYWALVPHGTTNYPPYDTNDPKGPNNEVKDGEPVRARWDSPFGVRRVAQGVGALKSGKVAVANADTEVTFNITGLEPETNYDLYYVGEDAAGNFTTKVQMVTLRTLDTSGPVVKMYFINPDKTTIDGKDRPPANATIVLDFSENVTIGGGTTDLLSMDTSLSPKIRAQRLRENLVLNQIDAENPELERLFPLVNVTGMSEEDKNTNKRIAQEDGKTWIDYDKVVIQESKAEAGHVEVVFEYDKAICMKNGRTYFFELNEIVDISGNYPLDKDERPITTIMSYRTTEGSDHVLPKFTTAFASVRMSKTGNAPNPVWAGELGAMEQASENAGTVDAVGSDGSKVKLPASRLDFFFSLTPESTKGMLDNIYYDIFLFADQSVGYDMYYRIIDTENRNKPLGPDDEKEDDLFIDGAAASKFEYYKLPDSTRLAVDNNGGPIDAETNGWIYLGNYKSTKNGKTERASSTVVGNVIGEDSDYPRLNRLGEGLRYEFFISVTEINNDERYKAWTKTLNFEVYVLAGGTTALRETSPTLKPGDYIARGLESIGVPAPLTMDKTFTDSIIPVFVTGYPSIDESDTSGLLTFLLNPPTGGTLYYRIGKASSNNSNEIINSRIKVMSLTDPATGKENEALTKAEVEIGETYDLLNNPRQFRAIIEAQSALGVDMGQLYFDEPDEEGNRLPASVDSEKSGLWYYKVVDAPGTIDKNMIATVGDYNEATGVHANTPYPEPNYIVGAKEYQGVGGPDSVKLPQYGTLKANTQYYIYITLEGASAREDSRSQVYIFTFKTSPAANPRITLQRGMSSGYVDISTEQVNTTGNWVVIEGRDANATRWLNSNFTFDYGDEIDPARLKDDPSSGPKYSIYEALSTTYYARVAYGDNYLDADGVPRTDLTWGTEYDGLSVFDVFADFKQRQNIGDIISSYENWSGNQSNQFRTLSSGPFSTLNGSKDTIHWATEDVEDGEYVILAAGRNKGRELAEGEQYYEVDSFRALRPLFIQSLDPPELEKGSTYGDIIKRRNTVTGRVSFSLYPEAYWAPNRSSDGLLIVDQTEKEDGTKWDGVGKYTPAGSTESVDAVGILNDSTYTSGVPSSNGLTLTPTSGNGRAFTIEFNHRNLPGNGSVTIQLLRGGDGIIAKGGVSTGRNEGTDDPNYYPYLTIIIGASDDNGDPYVTVAYHYRKETFTGFDQTPSIDTPSASAATPVAPAPVAPTLNSVSATNVKVSDAGSYSMTLNLEFDQALYTKSGTSTKAVDGKKLATKSTVGYTPTKSGGTLENITSSSSGKKITLTLKNVKPGTITLPSQTFYDKTGQASTTGAITVEISEVKGSGNAAAMAITTSQIAVSFDKVKLTKPLK